MIESNQDKIAVVIPCFRVTPFILDVISRIGSEVSRIIVVDDCCPQNSGQLVEEKCRDERVTVHFNEVNLGVGGATLAGFQKAVEFGADVIVKVDGDGQMDPRLIPQLIKPIVEGRADYVKGNRFYDLERLAQMPRLRIFGNACLSFMTKLSSGYWNVFDPTNGFLAIHSSLIAQLPLEKIDKRFFFESDLLFRLNTIRAVVVDVPMCAYYGEEESNLNIIKVIPEFFLKNIRNLHKRLVYNYFLRDFSVASLELVFGSIAVLWGVIFGVNKWFLSHSTGIPVTSGTVMLAALPIIIGFQLLLAFLNYDIGNIPKSPLSTLLYKSENET